MTAVLPNSDEVNGIERKRNEEQAVPPIEHSTSEDIAEQQRPSSDNQ